MLHVSDLSVGYGRKAILSQLDFRIEAGSLTVILGRNGCGKSTLLRCLSGQKKPLQGTVSWNGAELFSLKPSRLAQTLALLPQGLPVPDLTVRELVACGRAPWGRGGEAQIAQAMVTADVAQLAGTPMEQLSGGERQRAWLAMTPGPGHAAAAAGRADHLPRPGPAVPLHGHAAKPVQARQDHRRNSP